MIAVVDLFCGAGGLTHGLRRCGLDVIAGIDVDPACDHPYSHNNDTPFLCEDASRVTAADILELYGRHKPRVLVGCAPCQPFSRYARRNRSDQQWSLLNTFADLIVGVRPTVVSMENVPDLTRHAVYQDFVAALERTCPISRGTPCTRISLPPLRGPDTL